MSASTYEDRLSTFEVSDNMREIAFKKAKEIFGVVEISFPQVEFLKMPCAAINSFDYMEGYPTMGAKSGGRHISRNFASVVMYIPTERGISTPFHFLLSYESKNDLYAGDFSDVHVAGYIANNYSLQDLMHEDSPITILNDVAISREFWLDDSIDKHGNKAATAFLGFLNVLTCHWDYYNDKPDTNAYKLFTASQKFFEQIAEGTSDSVINVF